MTVYYPTYAEHPTPIRGRKKKRSSKMEKIYPKKKKEFILTNKQVKQKPK